jgi:hypothetical protein
MGSSSSSSNYYSKQELLRATCATTTLLLLPLRARLGKASTIFCAYNGGGDHNSNDQLRRFPRLVVYHVARTYSQEFCSVCALQVLDCRLMCKFKFSIADKLCASSSSRLQTCCVQVGYRFQTCVQVQVLDCRLVVCKFQFSIPDLLCARSSSSRLQTCYVQEVQVLDCRQVVCKFKF